MLDCMNGLILNFYFHLNILLIPTIDERVDQRTHFNRRTVVALSNVCESYSSTLSRPVPYVTPTRTNVKVSRRLLHTAKLRYSKY